ncbi:MAG TPA: acyltransferase, partial [Chloroflexi bacterium]|nr:acyltransferase [Chloroflexota bacterium]
MQLRVAMAQIDTKLGGVDDNLDKHLEYIDAAIDQRADVVVFPALSLTGYVLQD